MNDKGKAECILTVRKSPAANECKVCKVWLVIECKYAAGVPKAGLYLHQMWKNRWKTAAWQKSGRFLKKAAIGMARLSGAAALTYLYSVKAIESAFLHRGYVAYGGEYLMIPFVFYAVFKALGIVGILRKRMFRKQRRKG